MATTDDLGLSATQAAVRAGVHPNTVRYWSDHGQVRYRDTPLGRLYQTADVERHVQQRRQRQDERAKRRGGSL